MKRKTLDSLFFDIHQIKKFTDGMIVSILKYLNSILNKS